MQKAVYYELLQITLTRIFGELPMDVFESVVDLLEWKEIAGGEILFHKNDEADCLYGVLSGRLRAYVPTDDGSEIPLGEIPPGETVGEMGIFTESPRSASIVAIRDSVLVKISKTAFEKIIMVSPKVVLNITN